MSDTETVFSSTDPDDPLLHDLNEWFAGRDSLDGSVELRMRPPGPGEMGAMADSVVVTAAAIPIAKSFFAWLEARVRSRKVSVELADKFHGRSLSIHLDRGQDAREILPQLQKFFAPADPTADPSAGD